MAHKSNKLFEQFLTAANCVLWVVLVYYVNFHIATGMFWAIIVISRLFYQFFDIASHPDVLRTDQQIIESRGYLFEEHVAKTSDDYYLTIHRIVNPFIKKHGLPLKPILLIHGMGGSSSNWFTAVDDGYLNELLINWRLDMNDNVRNTSPNDEQVENTLAFALTNRGYDVWLGNYRGTALSNNHVKYTQYDGEYWDYTIDQLIEHDFPTMIDYVRKTSGKDKIGYIGLSQGTTAAFGLLALKPEYNERLKPYIAMAPVTQSKNGISTIPVVLKPLVAKFLTTVLLYSNGNVIPLFFYDIGAWLFSRHPFTWFTNPVLYLSVAKAIGARNINLQRLDIMCRNSGRTSKKVLHHAVQMHMNGKFTKYDHGEELNQKFYGQDEPPEYNLDNISNKFMAFMCAKNDTLVNIKDCMELRDTLKVPLIDFYIVPNDKWDHVDFHFGNNVGQLVNKKVLEILRNVDGN